MSQAELAVRNMAFFAVGVGAPAMRSVAASDERKPREAARGRSELGRQIHIEHRCALIADELDIARRCGNQRCVAAF